MQNKRYFAKNTGKLKIKHETFNHEIFNFPIGLPTVTFDNVVLVSSL